LDIARSKSYSLEKPINKANFRYQFPRKSVLAGIDSGEKGVYSPGIYKKRNPILISKAFISRRFGLLKYGKDQNKASHFLQTPAQLAL
jgi:hypothetical protein